MTLAQEERVLIAALAFARADAALQQTRRYVASGTVEDNDGSIRMAAARERYKWKVKLLRAAGANRPQLALPVEKLARGKA